MPGDDNGRKVIQGGWPTPDPKLMSRIRRRHWVYFLMTSAGVPMGSVGVAIALLAVTHDRLPVMLLAGALIFLGGRLSALPTVPPPWRW